MKVRWIRDHQLGKGELALAGQVAELTPNEARRKVAIGMAVLVVDGDEAPPSTSGAGPAVTSSDPTVTGRGKKE